MKPSTYLEVICAPHLQAFEADPTAISKAWGAIVSLGQFADYLAADRNITKRAARKLIEAVFPQFDLVSDIANASKHFELSDPTRTSRAGYSIAHLKIGKSAAFSDGTFFSDGTSWVQSTDVVRADFANDYVDLLHLCRSCFASVRTIA
jgi:hypothetical protein